MGSGCQIKSHFNILGLSVVKKSWWDRSLCGGVGERLSNSLQRGEKVFWHFIILNELHKWTLFSDFVSSHARALSAQPPNTPRASSWNYLKWRVRKKNFLSFPVRSRSLCHAVFRLKTTLECTFYAVLSSGSVLDAATWSSRVFHYEASHHIKAHREKLKYSMFLISAPNKIILFLTVRWLCSSFTQLTRNFPDTFNYHENGNSSREMGNETGKPYKEQRVNNFQKSTNEFWSLSGSEQYRKSHCWDTPDGMIEIS